MSTRSRVQWPDCTSNEILAAMNSPATLGPGQTALTPASLAFYATAATVIPVLFLAIAVQGPAYQTMLKAAIASARSGPGAGWRRRVLVLQQLAVIGAPA